MSKSRKISSNSFISDLGERLGDDADSEHVSKVRKEFCKQELYHAEHFSENITIDK